MNMIPLNRTGQLTSLKNSEALKQAVDSHGADLSGDAHNFIDAHLPYYIVVDSIGSLPSLAEPPLEPLSSLMETLLDKMGERLAFERSGVRLYDILIAKVQACYPEQNQLLEDLLHFRREEAEHFQILKEAMESLGGDPTAQTPFADITALASYGFLQAVSDPRATLSHALNALLSVELTDNAAWELLIDLAKKTHQPKELIKHFEKALEQEQDHLSSIKKYLQILTFVA